MVGVKTLGSRFAWCCGWLRQVIGSILVTDCCPRAWYSQALRPREPVVFFFGSSFSGSSGPRFGSLLGTGWFCSFDFPGDRSCGVFLTVLVPCASCGLRGRAIALASHYALVSGSGFDVERRPSLNELLLCWLLSACSALILQGDFNVEVGHCGVRGDSLGSFAHGRRNRSGHQVVEWAKGEALKFLETCRRQDDRDTWSGLL